MFKKLRGLAWIEVLIIIAIIGILAALFISNMTAAIQRAKQRQTMEDMEEISVRLTDFAEEHGRVPKHSGIITKDFSYLYLSDADLTIVDQWGHPIEVYSGLPSGSYVKGCIFDKKLDFVIISYGRGGKDDGFDYKPDDPEAGFYEIENMGSFKKDLIMWNDSWIRRPEQYKGKMRAPIF